ARSSSADALRGRVARGDWWCESAADAAAESADERCTRRSHRGSIAPPPATPARRRPQIVAEDGRERRRGRLVAAPRTQRDLRPLALWRFAPEIPHPMGEAPLAQRSRKAGLHGANEPRRPGRDGEQRIVQTAALEILKERRA